MPDHIWITVIVVRTNSTNELTAERGFAIIVAGCWFTLGTLIERIRHERDEKDRS